MSRFGATQHVHDAPHPLPRFFTGMPPRSRQTELPSTHAASNTPRDGIPVSISHVLGQNPGNAGDGEDPPSPPPPPDDPPPVPPPPPPPPPSVPPPPPPPLPEPPDPLPADPDPPYPRKRLFIPGNTAKKSISRFSCCSKPRERPTRRPTNNRTMGDTREPDMSKCRTARSVHEARRDTGTQSEVICTRGSDPVGVNSCGCCSNLTCWKKHSGVCDIPPKKESCSPGRSGPDLVRP